MAAKVQQYIAATCKMQQRFAWAFRSCTNRIFPSVSTIYCFFHSASHSSGSDELSLQPSSWLQKLSSILQKLAKCCRALPTYSLVRYICAHRICLSFSTIYCSLNSASHSGGSDSGSLQPSLWQPKLSSLLQKLAKCTIDLHGLLGVLPIEFFTHFLQYTALSTQSATHVALTRDAYSPHYGCQS